MRHFLLIGIFFCLTVAAGEKPLRVVCLGDSLTAGYGLAKEKAWPALIQKYAEEAGYNTHVQNAGISGETTAGGRRRVAWLLKRPADILIISLGGNDGLRGINPDVTKENLEAIVDEARKRQPKLRIIVSGMQMPPSMGQIYTDAFREVYPTIAKEKSVTLIPFLLEGVGGIAAMNLDDGIHPNEAGHLQVAKVVWEYLKPVLDTMQEPE